MPLPLGPCQQGGRGGRGRGRGAMPPLPPFSRHVLLIYCFSDSQSSTAARDPRLSRRSRASLNPHIPQNSFSPSLSLLSSPLCFASAPHPIPHPDPKHPHAYILLRFASTLLTPTSSQALPQPPASPLSSLPYAAPRRAGKHFFSSRVTRERNRLTRDGDVLLHRWRNMC